MEIKQVKDIMRDIRRMPHAHHLSYMKRCNRRGQQLLVEALGDDCPPKLAAAVEALAQACADEERHYLPAPGSPLTALLAVADRRRDTLLAGLRAYCEAMLRIGTDAQQEAARTVLAQLRLYRLRGTLRYEDEGITMASFVSDCQQATPVQQAIAVLGQADVVARMQAANDEAMQLVSQRNQERAQQDTQALNKARRATDEAYRHFIQLLNAFAVVEAEEPTNDSAVAPTVPGGLADSADTDDATAVAFTSRFDPAVRVLSEDIRYYYTMVLRRPKSAKGGADAAPAATAQAAESAAPSTTFTGEF